MSVIRLTGVTLPYTPNPPAGKFYFGVDASGVAVVQDSTGSILSLQGAVGPQGVTGLLGETGIQGTTGVQGNTGIQGPTGIQGTTGVQGETGAQGNTGIQGTTGIQGIQGDTGVQGETGPLGNTGIIGNTGIQGPTGTQGETGIQGNTGALGNTGLLGETGLMGPTGIQGPTGLFATTGILLGVTGVTDNDILVYDAGVDRWKSSRSLGDVNNALESILSSSTGWNPSTGLGVTGPQGPTGLGVTGPQGPTGLGVTGPQGPTGLGVTGPQGLTEINYDDLNKYFTVRDAYGVYTTLEWKSGSTLRKDSKLSGGTAPEYTTRTVRFFAPDGVTVTSTLVYTLTYSGDELISEVI